MVGPGGPTRVRKVPDRSTIGDFCADPLELAAGYEQLRAQVLAGHTDGWRLGWGVLATKGLATWIRAWPTAGAGHHGRSGTQAQASTLSTTTPSTSIPSAKGGADSLACRAFLPAVTADIVSVLAAMTLAHAN